MSIKPYRIVIPDNVREYRVLIKKIDEQNDALGAASPLVGKTAAIKQALIDMTRARDAEEEADELRRQAEKLTEERNILWKETVLPAERGWRAMLEGENIENIHKMGDFGYEINSSPQAKGTEPPPQP